MRHWHVVAMSAASCASGLISFVGNNHRVNSNGEYTTFRRLALNSTMISSPSVLSAVLAALHSFFVRLP